MYAIEMDGYVQLFLFNLLSGKAHKLVNRSVFLNISHYCLLHRLPVYCVRCVYFCVFASQPLSCCMCECVSVAYAYMHTIHTFEHVRPSKWFLVEVDYSEGIQQL